MNLDYPNPFIIKIEVKETDIDELGHGSGVEAFRIVGIKA